jgi:hypothetical protein
MNRSAAIDDPRCEASQIRETSFVKREAFFVPDSDASRLLPALHARAEYSRLLTAVTFFCSVPQARSSVTKMGPIRDARPGNLAGMHAIGEVFGQNNPGTDAGKCGWLIRSVFKEE